MGENQNIDLLSQFFKVQSLLNKLHLQNHRGERFSRGIHRGQGRVLSLLKVHPEITQKELLRLLDMRAQSLGELLSKLEGQGFIKRTPSEKDRRVMVVKLTPMGLDEINKNEQSSDPANKIFDILSENEKKDLGSILEKITNELEINIGDEDKNYRHIGHPNREDMIEHFMKHYKKFANKTEDKSEE